MTSTEKRAPAPLGTVRMLPTSSVRPSADNPRKIPQAAVDIVAESIATFGWQQPLVVDVDHVLIAGHTRLKAAQKLGLKSVPVVIADGLTPDQVRAYRIADNRSGDFSSWDFPALAQQLNELAEDFSDVLALANWEAVIADYQAMVDAAEAENPWDKEWAEGTADEATANYLMNGFQLTVICEDETAARRISAALIDMPGVMDVRDKRS